MCARPRGPGLTIRGAPATASCSARHIMEITWTGRVFHMPRRAIFRQAVSWPGRCRLRGRTGREQARAAQVAGTEPTCVWKIEKQRTELEAV